MPQITESEVYIEFSVCGNFVNRAGKYISRKVLFVCQP